MFPTFLLSYWREALIVGLVCVVASMSRKSHFTGEILTTLSSQLSAERMQALTYVEKAINTERIVETEIVEVPGKTITKVVEREKRVEVEAAQEVKTVTKIEEKIVEKKVEVPAPADHTISVSIYKTADLDPKSWGADVALKIDSLGADMVLGANGDVTNNPTYYGGLRWMF